MDTEQLEPPDTYITLARAAQLSGLSHKTLNKLANPRNDKAARLRTVRLGHDRLTTRRWLHEYLVSRDDTRQQVAALPEGYQVPE